jgi:uncharacterized protein (TIGR02444 family)
MSFWDWAVRAYARPEAAALCLELQDGHDQSVPYLMWAAWAALEGRMLDDAAVARGAALAQAWEEAAVGPLRQVRRAIKAPVEGLDEAAREAFRAKVKAVELAAERTLMEALGRQAPEPGPRDSDPGAALVRAGRAWRSQAPEKLLLDLMAKLA